MSKQSSRRQKIALVFGSLLFTFLAIEAFLRFVDPLSAHAYFGDLAKLRQAGVPHSTRGYVLQPGHYELSDSTVTIQQNNTRLLPDTNLEADCAIAFLGDSVTFGQGVSDADTFANKLAREFQSARFTNTAFVGYNSANIRSAAEETEVDGYVYFVISNDADYPVAWQPDWQIPSLRTAFASGSYLLMAYERLKPSSEAARWPEFEEDIEVLAKKDYLLMFALEDNAIGREVSEHFPALIFIPVWRTHNSPADVHPDAAGHDDLFNSMAPHVAEWLPVVCNEGDSNS